MKLTGKVGLLILLGVLIGIVASRYVLPGILKLQGGAKVNDDALTRPVGYT